MNPKRLNDSTTNENDMIMFGLFNDGGNTPLNRL